MLIDVQVRKGEQLLAAGPAELPFMEWEDETKALLDLCFGTNTSRVVEFSDAGMYVLATSSDDGEELGNMASARRDALVAKLSKLKAMAGALRVFSDAWPTGEEVVQATEGRQKVFIVHGHRTDLSDQVARVVTKLGLNEIILHEQLNEGRTIIEKFELHAAEAGYAVVLVTADDIGGSAGTPFENLEKRARQNVIYELGYFAGRLGRARVCALYEDGVKWPSDLDGLVWVGLKGDEWRHRLARELKKVMPGVDLNKLA